MGRPPKLPGVLASDDAGERPALSPGYLAAGGDSMSREEAVRFFKNEEIRIKANIRALPVAEKLRLAADFLDKANDLTSVAHRTRLARNVASLALRELDEKIPPEAA